MHALGKLSALGAAAAAALATPAAAQDADPNITPETAEATPAAEREELSLAICRARDDVRSCLLELRAQNQAEIEARRAAADAEAADIEARAAAQAAEKEGLEARLARLEEESSALQAEEEQVNATINGLKRVATLQEEGSPQE